jgi:hypothetical protein
MYIPFENMPDHARVWIYQANRTLTSTECQIISESLATATQNWEAHGAPLQASFEIRFNQVVVLAVNESINQASGCSIDSSTRWFKDLATNLDVDFFNRDLAVVRGNSIELIPFGLIKTSVQTEKILPNDMILTPLTDQVLKYRNGWISAAQTSYIQKHF